MCIRDSDYLTGRLLDEAGVDIVLVGDSLGMVVLGFPDTTHVTLDHMLHHVEATCLLYTSNSEYRAMERGSETVGDKLHCREGNNPDQQLRCLNNAQWKGCGLSLIHI